MWLRKRKKWPWSPPLRTHWVVQGLPDAKGSRLYLPSRPHLWSLPPLGMALGLSCRSPFISEQQTRHLWGLSHGFNLRTSRNQSPVQQVQKMGGVQRQLLEILTQKLTGDVCRPMHLMRTSWGRCPDQEPLQSLRASPTPSRPSKPCL